MSGVYPVTEKGPDTYTVSATVTGGQLVFPDGSNAGMVKPTTGVVDGVLGMAMNDAVPAGSGSGLDFATAPSTTSVAHGPSTVPLTAAGNIVFGALVTSAASGQVATIGSGTFDQAIGRCVEPLGITSGSTGRIRLFG
jgi:hypothetical protein